VLPTLWFRNVWSWGGNAPRPVLRQAATRDADGVIAASHPELGERLFYAQGAAALLFTENETNSERLFNSPNRTPYVKDGIDTYIVHGRREAVNPEKTGTKAAAHYPLTVGAEESRTLRLRLCDVAPAASALTKPGPFGSDFDAVMRARRQEADEFYAAVIPASLNADAANVMRQALAGMLWSKQFYYYDVNKWLEERGADPFKRRRAGPRNDHWHHMYNAEILSMPDKWEYPWYAAWDLAFHVLALTLVDEDFGKAQLDLMLGENYLHPSGQLPAYEWNFGDVNPLAAEQNGPGQRGTAARPLLPSPRPGAQALGAASPGSRLALAGVASHRSAPERTAGANRRRWRLSVLCSAEAPP
jgi:hypothetical protein